MVFHSAAARVKSQAPFCSRVHERYNTRHAMPTSRHYGRAWHMAKTDMRTNPVGQIFKRTHEVVPPPDLPSINIRAVTSPQKIPTRAFSSLPINPLGSLVFGQLFDFPKMIPLINEKKMPIKELFETSSQAVAFLTQSPARGQVKYLDFTGLTLNDEQFKQIVQSCPNLTHLILWDSKISKDALKHLKHVPKLVHLNIQFCTQLDSDSLKYLVHVPKLLELIIAGCDQLRADSLLQLKYVPLLRTLVASHCHLSKDALHNLKWVPNLRTLDVSCCDLEADALKHLKHVPHLIALYLTGCNSLAPDALRSLAFVPNLRKLSITGCRQFESLDSLSHVSNLNWLSVQDCMQLRSLQFLQHVRHLLFLDIACCAHLAPNSLRHLKHVPILTSLILTHCTSLDKEALQQLKFVLGLTRLDITGCKQLSDKSIEILPIQLRALRTLNMALCPQVSHAKREQITLALKPFLD